MQQLLKLHVLCDVASHSWTHLTSILQAAGSMLASRPVMFYTRFLSELPWVSQPGQQLKTDTPLRILNMLFGGLFCTAGGMLYCWWRVVLLMACAALGLTAAGHHLKTATPLRAIILFDEVFCAAGGVLYCL